MTCQSLTLTTAIRQCLITFAIFGDINFPNRIARTTIADGKSVLLAVVLYLRMIQEHTRLLQISCVLQVVLINMKIPLT